MLLRLGTRCITLSLRLKIVVPCQFNIGLKARSRPVYVQVYEWRGKRRKFELLTKCSIHFEHLKVLQETCFSVSSILLQATIDDAIHESRSGRNLFKLP